MQKIDTEGAWRAYRAQELGRLRPVLAELGYTLDEAQPHIAGERHLTGSGGRKLVLLGRGPNGRAVLKASSDPDGIAEMARERECRDILERIGFAYQTFRSPKEFLWQKRAGLAVFITEFIEQDRPFLERPIEEQFSFALHAFKAQESAHATTASHLRLVRHTFGEMRAKDYLAAARRYAAEIGRPIATEAAAFTEAQSTELERYCGFLTHWDFTPQNIRIRDGALYLLDHSSLRFGNKYEGWARFINFMELYNPPLAHALVRYVRDNRAPKESLSLQTMRAYRLLELVRYYTSWLPRTDGNLHELAQARIDFWSDVLRCVLGATEVPRETIESYKKVRDSLRSEEEKRRQSGLH